MGARSLAADSFLLCMVWSRASRYGSIYSERVSLYIEFRKCWPTILFFKKFYLMKEDRRPNASNDSLFSWGGKGWALPIQEIEWFPEGLPERISCRHWAFIRSHSLRVRCEVSKATLTIHWSNPNELVNWDTQTFCGSKPFVSIRNAFSCMLRWVGWFGQPILLTRLNKMKLTLHRGKTKSAERVFKGRYF